MQMQMGGAAGFPGGANVAGYHWQLGAAANMPQANLALLMQQQQQQVAQQQQQQATTTAQGKRTSGPSTG